MTRNGTGNANVCTRSTTPSPASAAASVSSSCLVMISSMPGFSRSSRRIVNSGVSSLRCRVCSGGSVKPRPPMSPFSTSPLTPMKGRMSVEWLTLPRTSRPSSYPVISQISSPISDVSRWTGSFPR